MSINEPRPKIHHAYKNKKIKHVGDRYKIGVISYKLVNVFHFLNKTFLTDNTIKLIIIQYTSNHLFISQNA